MLIFTGLQLSMRRVKIIYFFMISFYKIYHKQGLKGLVLYLKACSVATQQSLGGYIVADSAKFGKCRISRTNRGLPRIIPRDLRTQIRASDLRVIRFVLTVLAFYRLMEFPGKPDLSTITAPSKASDEALSELERYYKPFVKAFIIDRGFTLNRMKRILQDNCKIFPIFKSSPGTMEGLVTWNAVEKKFDLEPNFSTSPVAILQSLRSLYLKNLGIWDALTRLNSFIDNEQLRVLMQSFLNFGLDVGTDGQPAEAITRIGKLSAKEEAAGKVRIFAMVDPITQWALYPLHKLIFAIVRDVPMDGTFNQLGPLSRLQFGSGLYSVDLTAATDRLPIRVQVALLREMLGSQSFAEDWALVLVGRAYSFYQKGYEQFQGSYRYATGQPMGALSSWAMLDITHHFLVQVAYWRAYPDQIGKLFTNYAVLGDDLVIGDRRVYQAYIALLDSLGMPVNLGKSILSHRGTALEFAKRTIYNGNDVSPITVKDLASAQMSLPHLAQFAKAHSMSFVKLLSGLLFGWRVRSKLDQPIGRWNSQARQIYLALNIPNTVEEAKAFFALGTPSRISGVNHLKLVNAFYQEEVQKLRRKLMRLERTFSGYKNIWMTYPRALAETALDVQANLSYQRNEKALLEKLVTRKEHRSSFRLYTGFRDVAYFKELLTALWVGYATDTHKEIHEQLVSLPQSGESFYELYVALIQSLRQFSAIGLHHFSLARPEGSEGSETNMLVTPQAIRFYRAWSGIVQGALPIESMNGPVENRSPKVGNFVLHPDNSIIMVNPRGEAWLAPAQWPLSV